MRNLIFIAFIFFYSTGFAQITITKSDMPAAGDTLRMSNALPSASFDLTQTGANYTWDFSQLKSISQYIDTFFAISSLPKSYKNSFSGASFGTHTNVPDSIGPVSITKVYNIYKLNSTVYGGLGVGEEIDGLPIPITYDSTDVLYRFPLNYTNVDSSHTGYIISIPTLAYISEKRKRVNECDGWGKLTTPFGTFDVLRVKSTLTLYDSLYVDALSFGLAVPTINYQYKWLANGNSEPMLEIDTQDLFGTPVISQVSYRDSARYFPSGINTLSAATLTIFPNPVSDVLHIASIKTTYAPLQLNIYSVYGTLVYRQTKFNSNTVNVNISTLASGTYIAELLQGSSIMHKKFIVVH